MTERIAAYADLIVRVGANVQPGQLVFVVGLVEHVPLVRAVAESAYAAGARNVDVRYVDPHVRRAFIRNAPDDDLSATSPWELARTEALLDGAAMIQFAGQAEPDLLADLDQGRVGRALPIEGMKIYARAVNERVINWTIVAFPTEGRALQVFGEPDVERLWEAVSAVGAARRARSRRGLARSRRTSCGARCQDARRALALRRGSLPRPRHRPHDRAGARRALDRRRDGDTGRHRARAEPPDRGGLHLPRLAPHRGHRPLDARRSRCGGTVVRDLELRFAGGECVDVKADDRRRRGAGEIDVDDGAPRLGEVALVDGELARRPDRASPSSTRSSTRTRPATSPTARPRDLASRALDGLSRRRAARARAATSRRCTPTS